LSSSPIQIWKDGACVEVIFFRKIDSIDPNDYLKVEASVIVVFKRTSDKTSHRRWYHYVAMLRRDRKGYNEYLVLGTHMGILIYNEKDTQQNQYLIMRNIR